MDRVFSLQSKISKHFRNAGVLVFAFVLGFFAFNNLSPQEANETAQVKNLHAEQANAMHRSIPTRLVIDKINVDAPIVELGLDPKGALEIPKRGNDTGWYKNSPTPGEIGPAVIAGHYDWTNGPAIFHKLKELKIDDEIEVVREDGTTAIFKIERVSQHEQDNFPTLEVYGPTTKPSLRLITCAGSYDEQDDRYSHNYIVYAVLKN